METKKIINENFEVTVNLKIKDTENTYLLRIKNNSIPQSFIPGQFVMVKHNPCCFDPFLARPFSIFRKFNENEFEILYRVCGKGTDLLSNIKKGGYVSLTGPLGNGFDTLPDFQTLENKNDARIVKNVHVLVAGGIGIAPLFSLPDFIKNGSKNCNETTVNLKVKDSAADNECGKTKDSRISNSRASEDCDCDCDNDNKFILYYGSKTEKELYFRHSIHSDYDEVYFATDDGSFGYKGNIVDLLFKNITEYCKQNEKSSERLNVKFYACGPKPMLSYFIKKFRAYNCNKSDTSNLSMLNKYEPQVSLEEHFACGFGVCLGCVVKINSDNSDNFVFKRVCKDGPVFKASELHDYC
jgi:dihydroorotate dehydrogenase electron transfer subunit